MLVEHEAISRVAEASSNTPGGFSLLDLQHFSGHRDLRMLQRYSHLCTSALAKKLDAAFAGPTYQHRGRTRLKKSISTIQPNISDDGCTANISSSSAPKLADQDRTKPQQLSKIAGIFGNFRQRPRGHKVTS